MSHDAEKDGFEDDAKEEGVVRGHSGHRTIGHSARVGQGAIGGQARTDAPPGDMRGSVTGAAYELLK